MAGLRNNCYATLWSAKPYGKIYFVQCTVSHKNKTTGQYENDFTGTVKFCGEAATEVAKLGLAEKYDKDNPVKQNVKILSTETNSFFNKNKLDKFLPMANGNTELEYFIRDAVNERPVTVWSFEIPDNNTNSKKSVDKAEDVTEIPDDADEDEGLPFN